MADSIRYAGFYYDDALRRLLQLKPLYMPWHTEEDPEDPINTMLRFEAYRMHRDASLLDTGATELFWTTLQRRASALMVGKVIGYDLAAAIPAQTHIIAKITRLPSSLPITIVPSGAQFATESTEDDDAIVFEATDSVVIAGTALTVYTDGADNIYIGHPTLQFDAIAFSAAQYATGYTFQPEFWDANKSDDDLAGDWRELVVSDGTNNLSGPGTISWDIKAAHSIADSSRWGKTTVNGISGYWVRFSVANPGSVAVATPAASIAGDWWVNFEVLQGQTVDDLLGQTTSDASQEFRLHFGPFVDGSIETIRIGSETNWIRVENFLTSGPQDRVYRVQEDQDGWYVLFGDGTNGKIPGDGLEISAVYRVGADNNGNVGAELITVNRSSTPRLDSIANPLAATGWEAPECSTQESLDRVREMAPATLRANKRAVTLEDHETLAVQEFRTNDDRQPVARAIATRQGAALREIRVIVVGREGAAVSAADLAELSTYFNGTLVGADRKGGCVMAFATASISNYTPVPVNVTATIRVLRRFASGAAAAAEDALTELLSPIGRSVDTLDWTFLSNSVIPDDLLKAVVVKAVPGFSSFEAFSTSPTPIALDVDELPVAGTMSITVVEV
jgi:hypothetical protein